MQHHIIFFLPGLENDALFVYWQCQFTVQHKRAALIPTLTRSNLKWTGFCLYTVLSIVVWKGYVMMAVCRHLLLILHIRIRILTSWFSCIHSCQRSPLSRFNVYLNNCGGKYVLNVYKAHIWITSLFNAPAWLHETWGGVSAELIKHIEPHYSVWNPPVSLLSLGRQHFTVG